jgi:hypothetical protein
LPVARIYGICPFYKAGRGIHPEDEVGTFGPSVKVSCESKVGVTTKAHTLRVRLDQIDRCIDPFLRTFVTRRVGRPVFEEQDLLGIG